MPGLESWQKILLKRGPNFKNSQMTQKIIDIYEKYGNLFRLKITPKIEKLHEMSFQKSSKLPVVHKQSRDKGFSLMKVEGSREIPAEPWAVKDVLPGYRRNGLGKRLMDYFEEVARKGSYKRIEIGVIKKHDKLVNWYRGRGFKEKGCKRFDHLPFEILFMYKAIGG